MSRQAMDTFQSIHQDKIIGTLTTFDRMIFKGHLTMLYPKGAFARLLNRQGVLLKDFKPYVETVSQKIKQHVEQLAIQSGRPFRYLESAMTAKNGQSKENLAQKIAIEDKSEPSNARNHYAIGVSFARSCKTWLPPGCVLQ